MAEEAIGPAGMPPADSNEALRVAHDKREAAFASSGAGPQAAARARKAAAAQAAEAESEAEDAESKQRSQQPAGRSSRPTQKG